MAVRSIFNSNFTLNNLQVGTINTIEYPQTSQTYYSNTDLTFDVPSSNTEHTFWTSSTLEEGTYMVSVTWGVGNSQSSSVTSTYGVLKLQLNYLDSNSVEQYLLQSYPDTKVIGGDYPRYTFTTLVQQGVSGVLSLVSTTSITNNYSSGKLFVSIFNINAVKVL